jgi:hypothetical protein
MPITKLFDRFNSLNSLKECFKPRKRAGKHSEEAFVSYYSSSWRDAVLTIAIVFLGLGMLLGPLWWLNSVTDTTVRLKIITGAIIIFTVIFIATKSNGAFDILAAAAA